MLKFIKTLSVLILSFLLMLGLTGCHRSVSIDDLAREYSQVLNSKSLSDLSVTPIDRVKITLYQSSLSGDPIGNANSTSGNEFLSSLGGVVFSKGLNNSMSYSVYISMNEMKNIGISLIKGLQADENGNYYLTGRIAYDFLSRHFGDKGLLVTDGFRVEDIQIHEATLEIQLSTKIWCFKPFLTQQIGISMVNFYGEKSGTISPPMTDLLFTGVGLECNLWNLNMVVGQKFHTPEGTASQGFLSVGVTF